MRAIWQSLAAAVAGFLGLGCTGLHPTDSFSHQSPAVTGRAKFDDDSAVPATPSAVVSKYAQPPVGQGEAAKNGNNGKAPARPKVLLQWTLGPESDDKDDDAGEQPLASDRPDFVESSTNVGAGRVQLEMGYTYFQDRSDGTTTRRHSFPELLVRAGLWVDWLELRVAQNLGNEQSGAGALRVRNQGAEDTYLGLGVALTEQKGIYPESRVLLQATVPTGCDAFNDRHVLPGANFLYGWDVIEDRLSIAGSTQINRARDDSGRLYTEFAQAVTTGIDITKKLGMYLETFAFFPGGADVALPEYYADGGFIYRYSNNLQFDIRAGVGLNRNADDFFAGSGLVVRY